MKELIFLGLILFFSYKGTRCHEESIKNYLSSYKNIHVSNFSPALSNISFFIHVKYISLQLYGKELKIVLELYLPLHNRYECQKNLKETDDFKYIFGNELALYRGKVKNESESLVLGFFMDSGHFKGYIITDRVYCIEYVNNSGIAYTFQDVVLPGCKHSKRSHRKNCSEAEFVDVLSDSEMERTRKDTEHVNSGERSTSTHHGGLAENAQNDKHKGRVKKVTEDSKGDILNPTIVAHLNVATQTLFNKQNEWTIPKGESNAIKSETIDDFLGDLSKDKVNGRVKSLKDRVKNLEDTNLKLKKLEGVLGEQKHNSLWQTVLDKEMELLKVLENLDAELFNKSHLSQKNISKHEMHYMSCNIEVIVNSPPHQEQVHSNDLIRDIYLQTEMLNILFKKLSFKSKTKHRQINFHIEKIISPKRDAFSNSSSNFETFVSNHARKNHSCLVLGLDMTSSSPNHIVKHIKTKQSNMSCSPSIDPVVIKYGTTEHPMPMVLFLVAYATAVTKAFGATPKDANRHHLSPTSVEDTEKYFLTKHVPLENSEASSQYDIQEIDRCLPNKRSLRQLNQTKCGNALTEEGEQCDCGPELLCNEIDACCIPATSRSDVPSCTLRPRAQCSEKSPCCKNCSFSEKGTKCATLNDECPVGECDGERSACHCNLVASWNRSPCRGLECGAIICARVGLKPCICEGTDACFICCEKKKVCQTATFDLKVAGNTLFIFPDGSECESNKVCYNGTCGTKDRKYPFVWKSLKGPSLHHLNISQSASSRCESSIVMACLFVFTVISIAILKI